MMPYPSMFGIDDEGGGSRLLCVCEAGFFLVWDVNLEFKGQSRARLESSLALVKVPNVL